MGASNHPNLKFAKPTAKPRTTTTHGRLTATQKSRVRDAVDHRDRLLCQLTGRVLDPRTSEDEWARVHYHHIEERGRDRGPDATWNLISTSGEVHRLIHDKKLTVTGNADECVIWTLARGAIRDAFGRRRVPEHTRRGHAILVVDDADWPAYLRTTARHRHE